MSDFHQNGVTQSKSGLCKRCGEKDASYVIRQEDLCLDCFIRYVKTKVVKRMEAFRGRPYDPKKCRRYLLPVSLGASSIALLHILDERSRGQVARTGQANFELHCLHILESNDNKQETDAFAELQHKYPHHQFILKPLKSTSDVIAGSTASSLGSTIDMDSSGLEKQEYNQVSLQNAMSSPSSRLDLMSITRTKTIIAAAQDLGCEGILWGDTTTRLAEKVLAETAKGRGSSLPWIVNDGQHSDGIPFLYPLKDVLKKEVLQFAHCQGLLAGISDDQINPGFNHTPVKNSTIDSLMTEYFQTVEENYPSIVANVVRTSGKLQPNNATSAGSVCALCNIPNDHVVSSYNSKAGDPQDNSLHEGQDQSNKSLCYGCDRLMRGENTVG